MMMNFSSAIKELRVKNHYTQEQLADICGVSRQAVTKWEHGLNLPDIEKISQLAELFDVSIDELITGNQPRSNKNDNIMTQNDFAENEKIVNEALSKAMSEEDPDKEIDIFISMIGEKIGCDRIHVFESDHNRDYRNTYEWCSAGVNPQIDYLHNIPLSDMESWISAFSREGHVYIEDVDAIAESEPVVYRWLKPQGVSSLLAYPIFGGRSFLGIDNLAAAFIVQTSHLMELMTRFLESMLQRRDLMQELQWALHKNQQFIKANKGMDFHINLLTGEITYDNNKQAAMGYSFRLNTMTDLEEWSRSHPEFHDHLMIDGIRLVIDTKENLTIEFISYRDDRKMRWNRLSISPFLDSRGTVLYLYGVLQDVSDEHQIIEEYNKYISQLSGGVHVDFLSRPIHLEYGSDDLCAFAGYDREGFEQTVGSKYTNLLVEEDRPVFSAHVKRMAGSPGIESCEYRIRKKDGTIVPVIDTMESVADSNGIMYGYSYVVEKSRLHTMLNRAEANEKRHLAVINRQYEVLVALGKDYLNVFRVWLDEDKAQIVKLNGYVTKGMNRESAEYIPYYRFCKQYVQDRVHPNDRKKMLRAMHPDTVRRAFADSDEYTVVYRAVDKGETHFCQLKYVRLDDTEDKDKMSFVAGFKSVDDVIEEEHRQKEKLQGQLNIINAILKAFACGYYYGCRDDTFVELSNSSSSLAQLIGRGGSFTENRRRMETVFPDRDAFLHIDAFLDPATLDARLNGQMFISSQVFVKDHGWYELYLFDVDHDKEGNIAHCLFAAKDITDEKQQEEAYIHSLGIASKREQMALQYAYADVLTGVMNRNAFERDFRRITADPHVGFIYCDVNNLKETNNTHGHEQGDLLLQTFADLMKEHFSIDCIYRIGGDEFVCMIGNIGQQAFRNRVDGFIRDADECGSIAAIGASYGNPGKKDELLREAEIRMYEMKRQVKSG